MRIARSKINKSKSKGTSRSKFKGHYHHENAKTNSNDKSDSESLKDSTNRKLKEDKHYKDKEVIVMSRELKAEM